MLCFQRHRRFYSQVELVRDFIYDSLYHPTYGYFQKNVHILNTHQVDPIPFGKLRNQNAYESHLQLLYNQQTHGEKYFQLWHTPCEIFRPVYGNGVADYVANRWDECEPLIFYEVGPGNGTLCGNILDHLETNYPHLYRRAVYNVVEVSKQLQDRLTTTTVRHRDKLIIHPHSILEWSRFETRPCILLAMELLDNLPHDLVRFNGVDGTLEQAVVIVNNDYTFGRDQRMYREEFIQANDSVINSLAKTLDQVGYEWKSLGWSLIDYSPISLLMNEPRREFIPTGAYLFLQVISKYFPQHKLILSDFDALPDTIPIPNGPVVQTRYSGESIACSTYLLQKGLFDIFFPVDFKLISKLYQSICRPKKAPIVMKHAEFCRQNMDCTQTTTLSKFNPLLDDFENASVMLVE